MKLFNTILAVSFTVCAGQAAAAGLNDVEMVPMAYMSMPLGKQDTRKNALQFGIGLANAQYSQHTGYNFMNTGKTRLMDLSFSGGEFADLKINGIKAMERSVVLNADGTTTTGAAINYNVIIPAVFVGTIIYVESEDDDSPPPQNNNS